MTDNEDLDILIENLKDDDPDKRKEAAEKLGETGTETAIEPLLNVLNDENPQVRFASAKALGKIGEPAIDPLVLILKMRRVRSEDMLLLP